VRQHHARLYVINSSEIKLALRQALLFVKVKPGGELGAIRALARSGDFTSPSSGDFTSPGNGGSPPKSHDGGGVKPLTVGGIQVSTTESSGVEPPPPNVDALRERLQKESDTIILFGDEIQGPAVGELARWGLTLPGRTRFVALGDYANSRGAADMGLLPHTLPGYRRFRMMRHGSDTNAHGALRSAPGRDATQGRSSRESSRVKSRRCSCSAPIRQKRSSSKKACSES